MENNMELDLVGLLTFSDNYIIKGCDKGTIKRALIEVEKLGHREHQKLYIIINGNDPIFKRTNELIKQLYDFPASTLESDKVESIKVYRYIKNQIKKNKHDKTSILRAINHVMACRPQFEDILTELKISVTECERLDSQIEELNIWIESLKARREDRKQHEKILIVNNAILCAILSQIPFNLEAPMGGRLSYDEFLSCRSLIEFRGKKRWETLENCDPELRGTFYSCNTELNHIIRYLFENYDIHSLTIVFNGVELLPNPIIQKGLNELLKNKSSNIRTIMIVKDDLPTFETTFDNPIIGNYDYALIDAIKVEKQRQNAANIKKPKQKKLPGKIN